ncbi:MAG: hypothetical protein IJB02_05720 [Oscillospiraceae bacterium]|nr:hypothetical protein [Oscillospiraceae bacterium]
MKKRIITLLAVLALLVTCAVFAVQGAEGTAPTVLSTFKCPCSTCTETRKTTTTYTCPAWSDWTVITTSTSKSVAAGHYYVPSGTLTTTVQLTPTANSEVVILVDGTQWTVPSRGINLVSAGSKLHLIGNNGAVIKVSPASGTQGSLAQIGNQTSGTYDYHVYGDLTFKNKGTDTSAQGGYFRMVRGRLFVHDSANLGLTDSTKDPVFYGIETKSGTYGGVVATTGYGGINVYLEAGTFHSGSTGSIYMGISSNLYISGDTNFVTATGGTYDIYRTKGTVNVTTDWCDNDNTGFRLKDATITAKITSVGNGGLCDEDVILYGTLSGTTFQKATSGGDGKSPETGIVLDFPDRDNPPLHRISGSGYVGFITPRSVVYKNGVSTGHWGMRPQDAFPWYRDTTGTKHLKIWADWTGTSSTTVTIDNLYVDANGFDTKWKTNANMDLYVFDSAATTDAAGATVTVASGDAGKVHFVAKNGDATYILAPTATAGEYTVNKIEGVTASMKSVTVRPSANGIYYTAKMGTGITAPTGVADLLSIGVAVSLQEDAKTLATTAWTKSDPGATTGNGILVKNIIKDGNVTNVGTAIYARPCVTYNDELVYMGEYVKDGEGNAYSLTGVMKLMNDNAGALAGAGGLDSAKAFYTKWKVPCGWDFANLETA